MFLGVIVVIIILLAGYVYFADPLNLRSSTDTIENYDHPLLNETQEKALEAIGIDVSKIPSEITPEMEDCFVEKLGEERVIEIRDGADPTGIELFKARDCIN